ncbi:uncharacterized protein LOC118437786 isoform X1 [Folsomia candida]|uniref:uncharacterized protein LOC118437786 isoform X1 n=1 Tax=Folsomia candida TaxID=158441 RepID=UPI001605030D|nr:uncharacterized protein LOC118437786 isoform X1 [Folsomia candida]
MCGQFGMVNLVISSICSWLRVKDVKNCRLVSHDWNIAAKPILKQKSVINLSSKFYESDIARNERFRRRMASFGQPHHVHIEVSKYSRLHGLTSTNELSNVNFFTKFLSPQKLGITAEISSVLMVQFLEKILLNSSSNLVQVELGLDVDDDLIRGDDPLREFFNGAEFPRVKRLDLPFSRVNWSLGKVKVPQIVAAFPNITELRVDSDLLPVLFVEGGSSPRFLSKLWITGGMSGYKCNAILHLTQPLKHLHIEEAFDPSVHHWKPGHDTDISPSLYAVLSKNCHTLEYLDLGLAELREDSETWKFPSFPNLKRLNVMKGFYSNDNHAVRFDSEILNYSETFPKLEELQFSPWEGDWTPYFQSFFPAGKHICASVTRLHISDGKEHANFIEMFRERDQGKINARFVRILNLFPNADNLFMQELKSYLVKKGHILKPRSNNNRNRKFGSQTRAMTKKKMGSSYNFYSL